MNTKNLLAIWAKRAAAALALLATVGLMLPACEKEKDKKPEPNPYVGPMDPVKVFTFTRENYYNFVSRDSVMKYANDPRVEKIIYFLDSTDYNNDCRNKSKSSMHFMREDLEERINYAPSKAVGAGTFVISPGKIYPDDSIWFINHGWEVRPSIHYYPNYQKRCR